MPDHQAVAAVPQRGAVAGVVPTEHRLWLPLMLAAALRAGEVLAQRVLGHDIAVWRTASGALAAAFDRCPHRGTPLSLGAVHDEHLVCAYHGWSFATTGRCALIPAMPQVVPGERCGLGTVQVREHCGLVWVCLAEPHEAPLLAAPGLPAAAQRADIREVWCGPYEVATSFGRVMENFLDLAHFGFVHPGTLGDPEHAEIPDYQVGGGDATTGLWATGCRAWQPRSNLLADQGVMVEYRYEVPSPVVAVLAKCPQGWQAYEESIALVVLPVESAVSRVWFRIAMTAAGSTDADIRAFQDAIFEEDRRILTAQRPVCLPLDPQAEASCAIDRLSLAWRAYLRALGVGFGVIA